MARRTRKASPPTPPNLEPVRTLPDGSDHPPLVPVSSLTPNSFNPNKVPREIFAKLERDVLYTWRTTGTIPPVIYRMVGDQREIVDGYHRWLIFKQHGIPEVPAISLGVIPTSQAQRLCINLNYLKGDPDPQLYVQLIRDIMEGESWDVEEAAMHLPESSFVLEDMFSLFEVDPSFDFDSLPKQKEPRDREGTEGGSENLPEVDIEVVLRVPLEVGRRFEQARAALYDVMYHPQTDPDPDVDGTLLRLTARLVTRNISTREDLFRFMREQ